jgi:hypothetical protein
VRADDVASVFMIHERDASQDAIQKHKPCAFVDESDDLALRVTHNASVEASKQDRGIKSVVHFGLSSIVSVCVNYNVTCDDLSNAFEMFHNDFQSPFKVCNPDRFGHAFDAQYPVDSVEPSD